MQAIEKVGVGIQTEARPKDVVGIFVEQGGVQSNVTQSRDPVFYRPIER